MSSWQRFHLAFKAMASPCEILCWATDKQLATQVLAAARDEVLRIEAKYSRYREDSVIGRINAGAGRAPIVVDAETAGLLDYADAAWRNSGGAFDPTAGVLRRAWDFRNPRLPEAGAVERLLELIGWTLVQRHPDSVRLAKPGMQLDFGGFGKEYACDRAAGVLAGHGLVYALVNLGGDVRVLGAQPDGRPWRVGIQHPRSLDAQLAYIDLVCGALATSGDYQRYFELDGVRYCHLLDARNGWPVRDCAQSLSVVAPLCLVAGTAATCALLAGPDGYIGLQEREFLWVGASGDIRQAGPFNLR